MAAPNHNNATILRRKAVESKTGLSRSSLYKLIHDDKFPKPIVLATRSVGWLEREIDDWLASRIEASRAVQQSNSAKGVARCRRQTSPPR